MHSVDYRLNKFFIFEFSNRNSHDIEDVFSLADRVAVMKNGKMVGYARTDDVTKDDVLGMIILGKCPKGAVAGPGAVSD